MTNLTKMMTPWGMSDRATAYGAGITFYGTPSHGGFHLDEATNAEVPAYLRADTFNKQGERGWYEEDCDWAIVAVVFPDRFLPENVARAKVIMAGSHAEFYARFLAEKETMGRTQITPGPWMVSKPRTYVLGGYKAHGFPLSGGGMALGAAWNGAFGREDLTMPERLANAAAMGATPELLAACEALIFGDDLQVAIDKARAALARVKILREQIKGEQH